MRGFFVKLKVTGNLKTFIKTMVSLKFHDFELKELELIVEATETSYDVEENLVMDMPTINVCIHNTKIDNSLIIALDKSTAIKFSKELRKQIALLD